MTSRRTLTIIALLVIALVVLASVFVWRSGGFVSGSIAFSETSWRLASAGRRHHMANDFLQNHFETGMPLDELLELLGAPERDREHWLYFLSERGQGPEVGTPSELARYPYLAVRFRAGEVSAIFGESWLVEFGATQQPELLAFDRDLWLSGDPETRRRMAWKIEQSPPFLGNTHEQILDLLGEPDRREPRTLEYELGWGMADPYGLVFTVDDKNTVTAGNVIQH